jgi:tetratricopeptide (TPR) repeat protein
MTERIRSPLAISILLSLMVIALYFNILDNQPTNWDDPVIFTKEALHGLTWENLKAVLAIHSGSTYQPVRDLSYMIDFSLWGEKLVVFGMHLQSIILYILMVLACYAFLRELLSAFNDDPTECYLWASLTAVLYAVHPVHVESVAWLFGRKEPLLGIFTFLSLWAFIKGRIGSWKYYVLSAASLLLAILSKPTALFVPGAMIMLDIVLQARRRDPSFWKKRLMLYIPIFVVVLPMIMRLFTMMHTVGGIKPYHGGNFWTNLLAVSQILISYISLIGFTINYAADYPIPLYTNLSSWQPWVFLGLNMLLIGTAVWAFFRKRYLYSFFVGWYYLFLLPVSHIFPISQTMADRYALLPSLSWCVLLGYLFTRLWHLKLKRNIFSPEFTMALAIGLFSFVTLAYAYMTFRQNDIWQNSQILWEDTLAKYPNSSSANVNLSAIYIHQGRFREVQDLCITAIKALPYDYLAISNLALAQMMMKQYDNAIHNYKQALNLKPNLREARMGLATAYWEIKDYKNTYLMYDKLVKENIPWTTHHRTTSLYRLGYAAWKLGKTQEARDYLALAEPGMMKDKFLLSDLAGTYTSMKDMNKAYELYLSLYPMLDDGDAKTKLKALLDALRKHLQNLRG